MVLAQTGRTSHTLILARSFGIPVLSGIELEALQQLDDKDVFIDAQFGVLVTEPSDDVRHYFAVAMQLEEKIEFDSLKWLTYLQ